MRFSGIINAKIDAKGRVFLPSDFRKCLSDADMPLVLKKDVYEPCLVIYPRLVWAEEVNTLRSRLNRWNPAQAMIFRQFMAESERVELDGNGRFLIPKRQIQLCCFDNCVSFVGVDDRIELWGAAHIASHFLSPEVYAQSMAKFMSGEAAGDNSAAPPM